MFENFLIISDSDEWYNRICGEIRKKQPTTVNFISIDMTLQKWAIFIMGVYGENLCLLSDQAEISFLTT